MLFASAPLTGTHIVAVVGSGGKTSLLAALSLELAGTVVLTTTTHLWPFADIPLVSGAPDEVRHALGSSRVVCVGTQTASGKLAPGASSVAQLAALADHVAVEADGSRQLPLKAHAEWEPVVPAEADACVLVVGASGLEQPIATSVHRPELFCQRAGCAPEDIATPQRVAHVIAAEVAAGLLAFDRLLVNQVATDGDRAAACALVSALRTEGLDVPYELGNLPRAS